VNLQGGKNIERIPLTLVSKIEATHNFANRVGEFFRVGKFSELEKIWEKSGKRLAI